MSKTATAENSATSIFSFAGLTADFNAITAEELAEFGSEFGEPDDGGQFFMKDGEVVVVPEEARRLLFLSKKYLDGLNKISEELKNSDTSKDLNENDAMTRIHKFGHKGKELIRRGKMAEGLADLIIESNFGVELCGKSKPKITKDWKFEFEQKSSPFGDISDILERILVTVTISVV